MSTKFENERNDRNIKLTTDKYLELYSRTTSAKQSPDELTEI